MPVDATLIHHLAVRSRSRIEFWIDFLQAAEVRTMAEVGVYRGHYAAEVLANCPEIGKYYMIDPWRHLEGWNKPANQDDQTFSRFHAESMARTEFATDRRVVLRGTTTEVIEGIPDESLDFVYVDGDHTLRGITIDLHLVYPKVKLGGWIGGDDFRTSIWQHGVRFEPTLVFPFAVYFAEAVHAMIFGLPHSQFLLHKTRGGASDFKFLDLAGRYTHRALREQFHPKRLLWLWLGGSLLRQPVIKKLARSFARRAGSEIV